MKSLILTVLYLAKDTVHRWFTRLSSPLARILVVYFLSLCALSALGSYAISTKIVRDKILEQGGDLVYVTMGNSPDEPSSLPTEQEISDILDADSYALTLISQANVPGRKTIPVYTYEFSRSRQIMPLLATNGGPTLLEGESATLPAGPNTATTSYRTQYDIFVRKLPDQHLLLRMMNSDGIIVQPDHIPDEMSRGGGTLMLVAKVRQMDSVESILRVERYFRNYMKLEGKHGSVISAAAIFGEMDLVLSKQTQCRLAFCVGISCIVGILLTALAGMEYRQNEYIYTLMKSFGIHPLLLVGAFITENILIVGASFAGAIATFMYFQRLIVTQILKLGSYSLTLEEIMPEIHLIAYTLLGCILISSLPIFAAANREIGRVLK